MNLLNTALLLLGVAAMPLHTVGQNTEILTYDLGGRCPKGNAAFCAPKISDAVNCFQATTAAPLELVEVSFYYVIIPPTTSSAELRLWNGSPNGGPTSLRESWTLTVAQGFNRVVLENPPILDTNEFCVGLGATALNINIENINENGPTVGEYSYARNGCDPAPISFHPRSILGGGAYEFCIDAVVRPAATTTQGRTSTSASTTPTTTQETTSASTTPTTTDATTSTTQVSSSTTDEPTSTTTETDSDGDGIPDIEDLCPYSDLREKIVIGNCNTNVENKLNSTTGCTYLDMINDIAADVNMNHKRFVSDIKDYAKFLKKKPNNLINGKQKRSIIKCAKSAGHQ